MGVGGRPAARRPRTAPSDLLPRLLGAGPEALGTVMRSPEQYEVQILYTQIDRDARNRPHFTEHAFRVDPDAYFYPASVVKLAGALVALEKLRRLAIPGLDRDTPLRIGRAAPGQTAVVVDTRAAEGRPTVGGYIERIFAVSDNDAYNRLYEFVGQDELNQTLWRKGYHQVRLTHRLSLPLTVAENRCTNPFEFYARDWPRDVIYRQSAQVSSREYRALRPILKGSAEVVDGVLQPRPKDFAGLNWMSVEVMQRLLRAVVFPASLPPGCRFDLAPEDRRFLLRAMSRLPRESRQPIYDPHHYYDAYVKFLLYGDRRDPLPPSVRMFNKVGLAYGFMADNAYVVDFEHGVEFLLTAVISVNANGVYNDDHYEYDRIGFPFLANVGRVIYDYERQRRRWRAPDLSRFVFTYDD